MKKNKHSAKKTTYNGVTYDSILEANFAKSLDQLREAGAVHFWIRQPKFYLPGETKTGRRISHRIDFLVFYPDGTWEFIDAKGQDLPEGRLRRQWVEEQYKIKVRIVKEGEF